MQVHPKLNSKSFIYSKLIISIVYFIQLFWCLENTNLAKKMFQTIIYTIITIFLLQIFKKHTDCHDWLRPNNLNSWPTRAVVDCKIYSNFVSKCQIEMIQKLRNGLSTCIAKVWNFKNLRVVAVISHRIRCWQYYASKKWGEEQVSHGRCIMRQKWLKVEIFRVIPPMWP